MKLEVTAYHMVEGLSVGLYSNPGRCMMELVRNGVVGCMPSDVWEPKRAKIEISLVTSHPLCQGKEPALIVLDRGCGLTAPKLKRYFHWLGTPLSELRTTSNGNGATQKGIGRLAALALNSKCLHEDIEVRIKNGYYLLTRTSPTGQVRFVEVIPEQAEINGFETERFVSANDTAMGPYKNIQGTFTAIVIPSPVFKTGAEIYEAIKWELPREHDKMFDLTINGKTIEPPPLEQSVNVEWRNDPRFRARLGKGDVESDGTWLCDGDTGLRVASCLKLGHAVVPEPLWYPDLKGDIFVPGLLRHQNTARETLSREFLRGKGKDWQKLQMFLLAEVVAPAKALMERDLIRGDAANTLNELVKMFEEQFGEPEPEPRERKPRGPGDDTPKPPEPPKEPGEPKPPRERNLYIKVRGDTYSIYRGTTLPSNVFAQVNQSNDRMIMVNVRGGYCALPKGEAARREHCLMQLLLAIGMSRVENRSSPYRAAQFANELRAEFLKKK